MHTLDPVTTESILCMFHNNKYNLQLIWFIVVTLYSKSSTKLFYCVHSFLSVTESDCTGLIDSYAILHMSLSKAPG